MSKFVIGYIKRYSNDLKLYQKEGRDKLIVAKDFVYTLHKAQECPCDKGTVIEIYDADMQKLKEMAWNLNATFEILEVK